MKLRERRLEWDAWQYDPKTPESDWPQWLAAGRLSGFISFWDGGDMRIGKAGVVKPGDYILYRDGKYVPVPAKEIDVFWEKVA